MKGACKQSRYRSRMLGAVLALFASSLFAATPAAQDIRPQAVRASKGKAVHYLENIPEARVKNPAAAKPQELPVDASPAQPVAEPPPLELKGVRG